MMSDATLHIKGYASRFDERDAGGDRVKRGAFAASLLSRVAPVPMLSDHQRPIGRWTRMVEDNVGLWVEGEITDRTVARLVQRGSVSGLSIGYRTRRARPQGTGRELLDIDLKEVSVVAFPMLRSAWIEAGGTQSETNETTQTPTHQRSPA